MKSFVLGEPEESTYTQNIVIWYALTHSIVWTSCTAVYLISFVRLSICFVGCPCYLFREFRSGFDIDSNPDSGPAGYSILEFESDQVELAIQYICHLYFIVTQNMLRTHEGKIRLLTTNRSNNKDCSLRASFFLRYHLI